MNQWNCNISKTDEVTVGEKLNLTCTGSTEGILKDQLQIKDINLSDEVPALSLLSIVKYDADASEFIVTSYRVGEQKSEYIAFYDGKNKIEVKGFNWNVKSILKQDPINPPQAFGAFPMWELSYPIWFWILLFAIIFSIVFFPYQQFKRIKNRKKAFDDLKNLDAALNPLDTFYKSVRRMEKALEIDHVSPRGFADQIDKDFKIFLSRSLQIPAHIWGTKEILKEINKKYPKFYRDHGDDVKKYFSEFSKLKTEVKKKDCAYLIEIAQKLTDTVDASLPQKRGLK